MSCDGSVDGFFVWVFVLSWYSILVYLFGLWLILFLFHSCRGFPAFRFPFFFTVVEMTTSVPVDAVMGRAPCCVRTCTDVVNGQAHSHARRFTMMRYYDDIHLISTLRCTTSGSPVLNAGPVGGSIEATRMQLVRLLWARVLIHVLLDESNSATMKDDYPI